MFGPSLLIFPSDGLSALVSDRASGVACFSRQHSYDLIESLHISLPRCSLCFLRELVDDKGSPVLSRALLYLPVGPPIERLQLLLLFTVLFVSGWSSPSTVFFWWWGSMYQMIATFDEFGEYIWLPGIFSIWDCDRQSDKDHCDFMVYTSLQNSSTTNP